MTPDKQKAIVIQETTKLKPKHFADLIRVSQLICDPAAGVSGIVVETDWEELGIPYSVAENLKTLGLSNRLLMANGRVATVRKNAASPF